MGEGNSKESEGSSPPTRRIFDAIVLASLLSGWIPWLGLVLAIVAGVGAISRGRPLRFWLLFLFALVLGLGSTAAFHLLPKGSLERGDPRLELLEERLQPVGNLEEKNTSP